VFVSGVTARDPATNKLVEGDITIQTERVLKNIEAVLATAGTSTDKVVKTQDDSVPEEHLRFRQDERGIRNSLQD
jgi:enamine deaminase RidA (YjgF/YER057c/UK114 family)